MLINLCTQHKLYFHSIKNKWIVNGYKTSDLFFMGLNLLKTIMGQYFTIYHTLILLSFNKYYAADNKRKTFQKGQHKIQTP